MESTQEQLTLFAVDSLSHVNRGAQPGSAEAKKMTVTSGRKCLESFGKSGPLGLLEKMLLESSEWDSMMCLLTWKAKATPAGRLLFQLAVSVRNTEETGFGLLPTPRATDHKATQNPEVAKKVLERGFQPNFPEYMAINFLPTPTALDHKDSSFPPGLGVTFKTTHQSLCKTLKNQGAEGRLNPEFVEVLMGFPQSWTHLP